MKLNLTEQLLLTILKTYLQKFNCLDVTKACLVDLFSLVLTLEDSFLEGTFIYFLITLLFIHACIIIIVNVCARARVCVYHCKKMKLSQVVLLHYTSKFACATL